MGVNVISRSVFQGMITSKEPEIIGYFPQHCHLRTKCFKPLYTRRPYFEECHYKWEILKVINNFPGLSIKLSLLLRDTVEGCAVYKMLYYVA